MSQSRQPPRKRYTLDNMRRMMDYLGNPQDKLRIIHVAGTSGKTSTCYYIARLLQAAGCSVGLSVSPHVVSLSERAQINGKPLADTTYCQYFSKYYNVVVESGIALTYFETLVGFAYWLFAQLQMEYAVIEVGVGGLLDCTNVVRSPDKIAVITDVGYDHMEILGNSISAIAAQKAGIIQPGNIVCMNSQTTEIEQVVRMVCKKQNATLNMTPLLSRKMDMGRNLTLAAAAVQQALRHTDIILDTKAMLALKRQSIPGRMETIVHEKTTYILDGAHNEQKINFLCHVLNEVDYKPHETVLLIAIGANKLSEAPKMLAALRHYADTIVLTTFDSHTEGVRVAISPYQLRQYVRPHKRHKIKVVVDPYQALAYCNDNYKHIIITGSFFLVAQLRPLLIKAKSVV